MRPKRWLTAAGLVVAFLFGSQPFVLADTVVTSANTSEDTDVKTGDATVTNEETVFVGESSSDEFTSNTSDEAGTSDNAGVASVQSAREETGSAGNGVAVVSAGNVEPGKSAGGASAPSNSADLVLSESTSSGSLDDALFVGLAAQPVSLLG